jgi:hypothetical protein
LSMRDTILRDRTEREVSRVRVEILILNIEGIPNVKPSIGKKKKRERSFSLPLALWHRVANAARNPCILHRSRGRIREVSFEIRDGSTLQYVTTWNWIFQ